MKNRELERFFWNQYAYSYDRLGKYYRPYQKLVQKVCNYIDEYAQGQPLKILDIGCGTGNYTIELARRGHQVIGIDSSPTMISIAERKNFNQTSKYPPKILPYDLNQSLPFRSESFDAIISVHVLYILPDHERFLVELRRIARKPSIVVVVNSSTPLTLKGAIAAQWRMSKGMDRLRSLLSLISTGFWNIFISMQERHGSYKLTSADELKGLLLSAGLKRVRVYEVYVGSVIGIGQWVK
ncbi:MAG: methyltransferase domain-containing protein [Actinobacteria bacterium]|nr:methyltransferase domain-containing protein [Actinomycetota bacterium]